MNIQEQEERDYNPQCELQNAYAQSRMETELRDPKIDEARRSGKWVVVINSLDHCLRTDACLGTRQELLEEHGNSSDAQTFADGSPVGENESDDGPWLTIETPVNLCYAQRDIGYLLPMKERDKAGSAHGIVPKGSELIVVYVHEDHQRVVQYGSSLCLKVWPSDIYPDLHPAGRAMLKEHANEEMAGDTSIPF